MCVCGCGGGGGGGGRRHVLRFTGRGIHGFERDLDFVFFGIAIGCADCCLGLVCLLICIRLAL